MAHYNHVLSREIVDKETGEVSRVELVKSYSYKCTDDNFVMLFFKYIRGITDLKSFKAFQVLMKLVDIADWNTGELTLSPKKRKNICDILNISRCNLSTHLTSLSKCGLISGKQSDYKINPQIFWKGELGKRKELLADPEFYVEFGFRSSTAGEDITFSNVGQ